jgi:hypothetical protein
MDVAHARMIGTVNGENEAEVVLLSPDVPVPNSTICDGILKWGSEQSSCNNEALLLRFNSIPQRYPSVIWLPRKGVTLANLKSISDDSGRTFSIIVGSHLESANAGEKRPKLDPGSATRNVGALQFPSEPSRVSYGKPSGDKKSVCEESNRGVGRFHLTPKFSPPAFLLPLALALLGVCLFLCGSLQIEREKEIIGGLFRTAGAVLVFWAALA